MCRGAAGPAAAAAESESSADDADTLAAVLATDDVGEVDLIDVSYSITMATSNQRQKRQVLSGINFAVGVGGTGGMLAVLGRSGAGKSSLLNAISQRGTGTVGGRVLLNGIDMMRRDKLRVGYVEQGDELPGFLTPREHLMVYAQLSGQIASDAEQQERVDLILRVLELTRTSDRRIGILSTGRRRGLSGGERKRLAIASVLMFNPPVLCLDEYTSGLDSETALIVTSLLRRIATAGKKAVISTIHQPSSSVYFSFDSVVLLSHGSMLYAGPPKSAIAHFASLGDDARFHCPQYHNPADWLIALTASPPPFDDSKLRAAAVHTAASSLKDGRDSSSGQEQDAAVVTVSIVGYQENGGSSNGSGHRSPSVGRRRPTDVTVSNDADAVEARRYAAAFAASDLGSAMLAELSKRGAAVSPDKSKRTASVLRFRATMTRHPSSALLTGRAPRWTQFVVLTKREMRHALRTPRILKGKIIITAVLSLLVGGIYFQLPLTLSGAQDRVYLLMIVGAMMGVRPMLEIARLFMDEKPLVNLEVASQMYTALPYFMAKTFIEVPVQAFLLLQFCAVTYPLAGLQGSRAVIYYLTLLVTSLAAQSLGLLLGASVSDERLLMMLAPVLFFPIFLFSGLLSVNVPSWIAWLEYAVFFKYSVVIFSHNEFSGLVFEGASQSASPMTGEDFLVMIGLDDVSVSSAWVVLVAFTVVLRSLAFIVLSLRLKRKMA